MGPPGGIRQVAFFLRRTGNPMWLPPSFGNHVEGNHIEGNHIEGNHIEGNHPGLPLLFVYFNDYTDQCRTFFNIGFKGNRIVVCFKSGSAHALVTQGSL